MSCIITGTGENPGSTVTANPTITPMNVLNGGTWEPVTTRTATVDGSGNWSLTLPVASETDTPSFPYVVDVPWIIHLPSGHYWSGTIPNQAGPITLPTLASSHNWIEII